MSRELFQILTAIQNAFGWTLIHSLWLGSLVALSAVAFDRLFPNKNNIQRHKFYKFLLISFLLISVFIFIFHVIDKNFNLAFNIFLQRSSLIGFLFTINLFWTIGFVFQFTKFYRSLQFLRSIYKNAGRQFPDHWFEIKTRLCKEFHLKTEPLIVHSKKAKSAFVYGILNPLIVIPSCWVNRLSYKEAECIIAHELSHILFSDHYYNAICNLLETVFFFNPGIRYIISKIRFQRELCADDSTCSGIPNVQTYASLILKLGENPDLSWQVDALRFSSEKNQLLKRVKNLLHLKFEQESPSKNVLFILISLLFISFSIGLLHWNGISSEQNKLNNVNTFTSNISFYSIPQSILYDHYPKNLSENVKEKNNITNIHRNSKNTKITVESKISEPSIPQLTIQHHVVFKPSKNEIATDQMELYWQVDSITTVSTNSKETIIESSFWEPMIIDSRQDLNKWIEIITNEALQSNLKTYKIISDLEKPAGLPESKNKMILLESHPLKTFRIDLDRRSGKGSIMN